MVLVVGGGPSGLLTSYHLCKKNIEVTLVEEDLTIGENPHCGGLVSSDIWNKLGIPPKHELVLNELKGMKIHLGSKSVDLFSKGPYTLVISRSLFDKYLYNLAKDAGTKFLFGLRAERIKSGKESIEVRLADKGFLKDNVIVLAEGLSRLLTIQVGGASSGKAIPSFQVLVRGGSFDSNMAHVFLEGKKAPYYFAYFIPVSDNTGRLGVVSNKFDPSRVCEKMIRMLGFTQIRKYRRWGVWMHGPIKHPKAHGIILVGDAGGFTKPLTGGGIVWGGMSARIAAEVISNSNSQSLLKNYISLSRRVFLLEAKAQALSRGIILDLLSPEALSLLFVGVFRNFISGVDYDFPFSKSLHIFKRTIGKRNYLNNLVEDL